MNCLLRDDDVSFLTLAKELELVWGSFFRQNNSRLNLAAIPFVDTVEFGSSSRELRGLGENNDLCAYLKNKINEGKIELLLHGYSHTSTQGKFEFESSSKEELSRKVRKGKDYLEDLFKVKISVFVPPHNALSREGLKAVSENGLNILAATPCSPKRIGLDSQSTIFFIRRLAFSLKHNRYSHGRPCYPFVKRFSTHRQLDCFSFIPGITSKEDIINCYRVTRRYNGTFCLALHYSELAEESIREQLRAIIENIILDSESRFVFASEVMGGD